MFFPRSKLLSENWLFGLEDLEALPDQENDDYSPLYLFFDNERRYLTIISYSETNKKIKFSKRDSQ